MMEKGVNLVLHAQVIVEGIVVKLAKFKDIPLQGAASKGCDDVSFHKDSSFKSHKDLKTLDKEYHVSMVNVFAYRYYLALSMRLIKMWVKIDKIRLIPPFGGF